MSSCSYYDLDAILAEEELIPVTNLFNFHHLAHLDPNHVQESSRSSKHTDKETDEAQDSSAQSSNVRKRPQHYLPQNTKIQMPLWSIRTWAQLGFLKIGLPRPFAPKVRQRLQADPIQVDLRSKSPWYYIAGMQYIDLVQESVAMVRQTYTARGRSTTSAQLKEWSALSNSVLDLKQTLLILFSTSRFRVLFDWTLSDAQEDVSAFTSRLTCMELELFHVGVEASHAHAMWKLYGSSRIPVSDLALRIMQQDKSSKRAAAAAAATTTTTGSKTGQRTRGGTSTATAKRTGGAGTKWKNSIPLTSKLLGGGAASAGGGTMGDSLSRKRARLMT
jgi:hypothetical protein